MNIQSFLRIIFTITLISLYSNFASAQSNKIRTFKFETKKDSHTAQIIFQTKPFDETKHKVFIDKKNQTFVDKREAFGTDGTIPHSEIASIKLYFDGKETNVPLKLYSDCFQPNFSDNSIKIEFGGDYKSVIFEMHGSDAAASYSVTWKFRKNGRHSKNARQDFNFEEDSKELKNSKKTITLNY